MTGRANGNGHVPRALRESLDRMVVENRRLRAEAERERARRAVDVPRLGRHCGFCGAPVCECGLEGWVGG